jgi:hypothetical protein
MIFFKYDELSNINKKKSTVTSNGVVSDKPHQIQILKETQALI